ncbi:fimbrial protein [Salmonella enterica]|nr:fimbrial protein [Salmonella enterica]
MSRLLTVLFVLFSGLISTFSARAADCQFDDGNLRIEVPQMAIPADTPDGTVLYSSPKITKQLTCHVDTYSTIYLFTTADYNKFTALRNGVSFNIYADGRKIAGLTQIALANVYPAQKIFRKTMTFSFEVIVDSSKGKIPPSGTQLLGGFESIYIMVNSDYSKPRAIVSIYTPQITYLPCSMDISVSPDTIDFSQVRAGEFEQGKSIRKRFSTIIKKSQGCKATNTSPFGINLFFEPTNSVINADGSLNLNNGLGLSISDVNGKRIKYNEAWKIDNITYGYTLKNDFTATLQKTSGQDLKTGPFSGDIVIRISYY